MPPIDAFIAQDAVAGVLLVVEELLEGLVALVGRVGTRRLRHQPAELVPVCLILKQWEGSVSKNGASSQVKA